MPEGCTEHPRKQPGSAGLRESSHPSPSWEQREQSPGVQGEDGHPPALWHHPHPTHKVPARAGSRSPLGGRGPRVQCRWRVWLLPRHGAAPGVLLWDGASPSCSAGQGPACAGTPQPAQGCRAGWDSQDDSPRKNSRQLPDPAAAGSRQVSLAWLSPSRCQPPPFPVPSLHQERSFLLLYQPHRDPRAHCRLPAQRSPLGCEDGRAPRLSGSPPQANTAHGSEGSPDPRAGGDIPPQSLGESRLHWARDPGRRRRTERRQHDRWAIKAISGMPGQALSSPWPPCTIPSFPPIPAGCEGRLVTHRPPTPGPRSPGLQPAWGTRGICPRSRGSRSSIGAAFSFQRSGKLLFVKQR